MPGRRVLFIANPGARGLAAGKRLDSAVETVAAEAGLDAELVWTQRPGHAGSLAREAHGAGVDLIFACGGDGTLNEVLNGLDGVAAEAAPAVGIVPGGTANVWAREAGIPRRSPAAAIRSQLDAALLTVDLGRIAFGDGEAAGDSRRFLLMASLGFDAESVATVNPALKRRVGQLAYIWAGLRTSWGYAGFDIDLALDGAAAERVHGSMLVVGNTRNYGALAYITAEASVVDGELDYVAFLGHGWLKRTLHLPRLFARRHLGHRSVLFRRAATGRMTPAPGGLLPHVQLDGEVGMEPSPGPVTLSVEQGAVRMPVPRPDSPLFRPPPRPVPAPSSRELRG